MVRMCHSVTRGTQQNHMTHTKKALPVAIISFLVVIGFTIPATTYAAGGDSFFFPSQPSNQPHEQLVVYAFGPSQSSQNQNSYPSYQPHYQQYNPYANMYGQQSYNPYTPNYASNNFPQMFQQSAQSAYPNFSTFNSKFVNNTYIAPQVMQYGSIPNSYSNYSYPQATYGYQPQQYSGPSYNSYGYGSYAQPTGQTDFWGNNLCNWGGDYQGYPCDRDPHQWIQDPYTGSWY